MSAQPLLSTRSDVDVLLGSTEPRIWTPPLRELTPETSFGFDVIDFARDVLGEPLDPWEEWAAIHIGELLPDGRPRFRTILLLVARQNGKTTLAKVIVKYWLFVESISLVLGTSTDRSYAKRTWSQVVDECRDNEWLAADIPVGGVRLQIGEETLKTAGGAEYTFAANNGRAGRSMTVHRWLCDELREHKGTATWDAANNAMNAVPDAQTLCVTNQGGDEAIVLHGLRESALAYINTGEGDDRLGLFEWSAPDGADPADPVAICAANPNAGRRLDLAGLVAAGERAKLAGGEELTGFRTEILCQRVDKLDPAIDPAAWEAAAVEVMPDLAEHRTEVALAIDVSLDGRHATLVAALDLDGAVYVETVRAWEGHDAIAQVRRDLPGIIGKVRPRRIAWLPGGPAAALTAKLAEARWLPRGTKVDEIRGDVGAVCTGLADLVISGQIRHNGDPMLTYHINGAGKLWRGDTWVFRRRGAAPVDGAYAVAAAAHLARVLPPPRAKLEVLL